MVLAFMLNRLPSHSQQVADDTASEDTDLVNATDHQGATMALTLGGLDSDEETSEAEITSYAMSLHT